MIARFAGLAVLMIVLAAVAALPGCTAVDVLTHSVDNDPVNAPDGRYKLDADHWSILFDVDHLGYSRFVSRFDKASATLDFVSKDPAASRIEVEIEAASVDTKVPALDVMVKGTDMFDAGAYPRISFKSTKLERTGPNQGVMTGDLTIRGQTHPVSLNVTFNGASPNPLTGKETLGFSAQGTFSRADFHLGSWYPAVGNEVHVAIQAEFDREG
ncbi:MAG: YceI family protein [Parvibaculaceae bacterium]|nr:YceI family protein [Parvibaculaceae bacterium]